jgi:hypothetical protein
MLQFIEIPPALQGIAAEACFENLSSEEPVAVKVFAMTVIANLCKDYPELKSELVPLIEDQLPFATAGFRSRARKVLRQIEKY